MWIVVFVVTKVVRVVGAIAKREVVVALPISVFTTGVDEAVVVMTNIVVVLGVVGNVVVVLWVVRNVVGVG